MNEDALVKLGLDALLGPFVQVHTQYPVQPPAQFVDVFVATDATQPERMWQTLGWLGKMGCHLALMEAFTSDLSVAEARHCLRKQLTLHHALELESEVQAREGKERVAVPLPWLWMLTWSHPRVLRNAWGMSAIEGWPHGFYAAPEGLSVGVVVLPELPRERSTLPLRMFGDEEVRQGLRQEYEALLEGDPMRQALGEMLTWWQLWVLGQPQDERVTRWFMDFHQVVQQQLQKLKEEGEARGKAAGLREGEARGKEEGLRAARAAVADLCEVLGIEVTEARKAHLTDLEVAGLEALRLHLKQHRAWPG